MVVYGKLDEHECFTNKEHLDRLDYDRAEFAPMRWDRLLHKNSTNFAPRSAEWCNELARILGDMSSESREAIMEEKALDAPFKIRLQSPIIVPRRRESSHNKPRDSQVDNKKTKKIRRKRPYDLKKQVLDTLKLSDGVSHISLPMLSSKLLLVYNNRIDIINTSDCGSTVYCMTEEQYKTFESMLKQEKQKDALEVDIRRKAELQESNRDEEMREGTIGFIQKEKFFSREKESKQQEMRSKAHKKTLIIRINTRVEFQNYN